MQKLRNLTTTSIKSLDEVIEAIGHIVNTVVYVLAEPSVHSAQLGSLFLVVSHIYGCIEGVSS